MAKATPLTPVLVEGKPVDWFFMFKFNASEEPGDTDGPADTGIFDVPGWKRPDYESDGKKFSRHYAIASSADPTLRRTDGIAGHSRKDPLGASFWEIYFGSNYYVMWNDQFYGDPKASADSPWGHSKGVVTWNEEGEGFVIQVTTPSWPGSASEDHPRETDGNTLGHVTDDDIEVSQHFFALKLDAEDLATLLKAMANASIVTAQGNLQVLRNGGPKEIEDLVEALGDQSDSTEVTDETLSTGVRLISKPSDLNVPPWQMVSALLGGLDMRVASWWSYPQIYSTERGGPLPKCWADSLGTPGAVEIATTGTWSDDDGTFELGLKGGSGPQYNHAKFGHSTKKGTNTVVFGDMNQQGAINPGDAYDDQKCNSSQNGRGGMFFVMENDELHASVASMLTGESAPTEKPDD